jgi:hypothetical protein
VCIDGTCRVPQPDARAAPDADPSDSPVDFASSSTDAPVECYPAINDDSGVPDCPCITYPAPLPDPAPACTVVGKRCEYDHGHHCWVADCTCDVQNGALVWMCSIYAC